MFPLFRSKLQQSSGAFIHQKTSGIHFIRRLLCFPFLIPTDWSVFFFFVCWLGMRALPSVARGLPDWLDSFRGKRAECFWALEFECETLGDAVVFPAKNTHFEEFAHSRKSTKSDFFCLCWGEVFHRNAKRLFAGVIAAGLGIQPQNCTVRTWKPPHLNIAEVTALTVWERTQFNSFLAIQCCLISSF